jgi:hypothetical protein
MTKAWKVKEIEAAVTGGRQVLYRTDGEHPYVLASAIPRAFDTMEPETYIFPATSDGKVSDWGELDGSKRGTMNIEAIMSKAYDVQKEGT